MKGICHIGWFGHNDQRDRSSLDQLLKPGDGSIVLGGWFAACETDALRNVDKINEEPQNHQLDGWTQLGVIHWFFLKKELKREKHL